MLTFAQFIARKWYLAIIYPVVFMGLALAISLFDPIEYRADSQILIIHKLLPNLDAYSASRASEKLGQNLAEIIATPLFLETLAQSQKINPSAFLSSTEQQKRNDWEKKVLAKANNSILEISVYDAKKNNAEYLNNAVIKTLLEKGEEFHGGGDNIALKVINPPLASDWPARPNFIINLGLGVLFGLLMAYWRLQHDFNNLRS